MAEKKKKAAAKSSSSNWDWKNLFGYDDVLARAQDLIDTGNMPQAVVFEGRGGLAKKLAAFRIAAFHFCLTGDGCGKCGSCQSIIWGEHPEVLVIDGSTELIKIDQIRGMQSHLEIKAQGRGSVSCNYGEAARLVVVIDIDHMKLEAANCMLKILEEPPEGARIYCTTGSFSRLLPTVRSRLVRWHINPPAASETAKWLAQNSEDAAKLPASRLLTHIERNALSPGRSLELLTDLCQGSESRKWKDKIRGLWQDQSMDQFLKVASELSQEKIPLSELLIELELQLNAEYRQYMGEIRQSLSWQSLVSRRAYLRRIKDLVVNKSIQMNNQLSIESVGLVYRLNES